MQCSALTNTGALHLLLLHLLPLQPFAFTAFASTAFAALCIYCLCSGAVGDLGFHDRCPAVPHVFLSSSTDLLVNSGTNGDRGL